MRNTFGPHSDPGIKEHSGVDSLAKDLASVYQNTADSNEVHTSMPPVLRVCDWLVRSQVMAFVSPEEFRVALRTVPKMVTMDFHRIMNLLFEDNTEGSGLRLKSQPHLAIALRKEGIRCKMEYLAPWERAGATQEEKNKAPEYRRST